MAAHGGASHGGSHAPTGSHGASSSGGSSGGHKFDWQTPSKWLGGIAVAIVILMTVVSLIANPGNPTQTGVSSGQQVASRTMPANAASDGCSGFPLTFHIGPSDELINGGVKCEMVGWNIDEGQVVLVASDGAEHTFGSAEAFGFTAKRWRAAGSSAIVTAAFCPQDTVWNGANSCD